MPPFQDKDVGFSAKPFFSSTSVSTRGLEFNYDNPKENEEENTNANENDDDSNNRSNDQEDTISLLRGDLADSELLFNDHIFRQLFLGFEVNTEKGR